MPGCTGILAPAAVVDWARLTCKPRTVKFQIGPVKELQTQLQMSVRLVVLLTERRD
jgi:hypothetical protein